MSTSPLSPADWTYRYLPEKRSSSGKNLAPKVGTTIKGEGRIAFHDVTWSGLHRLCVETMDKYPDVEMWMELLKDKDVQSTRYTERIVAGAFIGYLWFYFKEAICTS